MVTMNIPNNWNKRNYNNFISELKSIGEENYKRFNSKLIPNTKNEIIGIRIPLLRNIAKKIYKTDYFKFLEIVNNKYIEEVLIEGFLIGNIKDEKTADKYIIRFLPKIDNWCVCDTFCNSLKIVNSNKDKYFDFFTNKIDMHRDFNIRVSVVILNSFYIEDKYIDKIFKYTDNIKTDHYYVRMGIAWLISTCYVKFKDKTLKYLNNNKLDDFTYNMSIQKIIESKKVSKKEKGTLRKIKR